MNYLLNRNARSGIKFSVRLLGFFVVILLFAALLRWFPSTARAALTSVAAPFWRAGNSIGESMDGLVVYFRSKRTLTAEIKELRKEKTELEAILAGYELVVEENQKIKQFLGRNGQEKRILAAVLVSPPRAPYDTIILDVGTKDGVSAGDDILFGETVFGRVAAVSRAAATVELFSTAGIKTPVVIWRGGAAVPAEAVGNGGGTFQIMFPKEEGITVGDMVVMPGINPKQFARVAAVESRDTDSFAAAYLRNPVRVELLPFLEIRLRNAQ